MLRGFLRNATSRQLQCNITGQIDDLKWNLCARTGEAALSGADPCTRAQAGGIAKKYDDNDRSMSSSGHSNEGIDLFPCFSCCDSLDVAAQPEPPHSAGDVAIRR